MWKAILLWLGRAIVKAAAEEAGKKIAERKARAESAEEKAAQLLAEAARLQAIAKETREVAEPDPASILKAE